MKKILITGGAGFIGSHLSEKLLSDSNVERVVCIDNLDPVYPVSFKLANLKILKANKKFKFYKADIRNLKALRSIFKKEKPDYVVNLAAKTDTRFSLEHPFEYEEVNVLGVMNILEVSKEYNVNKVILFSSSSVYGNITTKPPFKETESTDFPLSPYGATKKAGEVLAYSYFHNHGLCGAIINKKNQCVVKHTTEAADKRLNILRFVVHRGNHRNHGSIVSHGTICP